MHQLLIQVYLVKQSHLVACFSEKQNEAKQKFLTYDKELYVVVQALRYGKLVSFLHEYAFVVKHRSGTENKPADAFSFVVD